MVHRWNEIDKEKPKYLCQCQFVHHKSHMDCYFLKKTLLREVN
jgi:hypothetical protein